MLIIALQINKLIFVEQLESCWQRWHNP